MVFIWLWTLPFDTTFRFFNFSLSWLQEVPEGTKDSPGGPWEMLGLLPLFDPPRHDTGDTVRRALELGVTVKMITGDQLAIAKETGRRLGMGTNMYPSSSLFGKGKEVPESVAIVGMDQHDLIEQADGFAGRCSYLSTPLYSPSFLLYLYISCMVRMAQTL